MNISQPVASAIGSVDFGFLLTEEIKSLSVKKIQNPTTFDTFLHPVPGGLYDLALGAWGDNPCATCQLKVHSCPGHVGHIELPVQVYHPIFMDQLLRLLRAKCVYCHHLKMSRVDVNKFICKLRLIQHGLLLDIEELENIHIKPKSAKKVSRGEGAEESVDTTGSESEDEDVDILMQRRTSFVRKAIRRATDADKRRHQKSEAVLQERRLVVKEFLASIAKGKKCANCSGISPTFRKDKYVKIFQKPLSSKEESQMVQGGFKVPNALLVLNQDARTSKKRKRNVTNVDEGIVADVADDISEEEEEEITEEKGAEIGRMVETEANPAKKLAKTTIAPPASHKYVSANEVHAALTLLFKKEAEILSLIYNHQASPKFDAPVSADIFFIRALAVPPNKYRPEAKTGNGQIAEASQNSLYKSVLTHCGSINQIYREISPIGMDDTTVSSGLRKRNMNDLMQACVKLQDAVNSLIDRDRNPIQGAAGMKNEDGIKQKLEKKEGLFRKNMMGKRVNFAARSVISPDPNIETNEIGVPPVFAKKLTYPEPVTNHNFYDLKEAVLNGVEKWPGAAAIENENGQVINLRNKSIEERRALANQLLAPSNTSVSGARGKKVHRHLNNGDIVLMNRQPTLHKPSIMGHRARVLPGEKTIRMHYANCNTYNADFDGDEMNMHFPQNEIARAEALQIADTDHQYLVATSGKPLRGLIQDHISIGVWLTNRDTFFDRESYQQLLYSCLRPENNHTTTDRILTVTPTIIKPRPLWSGKQVISTILKNIKPASHPHLTLTSKSSTAGDRWGDKSEEGTVIFRDGELLCGILDKSQFGASGGGLVHSIYEVYGHSVAGRLLGVLGRLLTKFLHMRAFTCGVEDLLLTQNGNVTRKAKLKEADTIGLEVAAKYVGLKEDTRSNDLILKTRLEEVLRDNDKQSGLDRVMNSRTGSLTSDLTMECMPAGLAKPFPKNHMQTMTTSGAKGSSVNASLISCNLGQQVLEGRRVPTMISGKTLPCFKPFETSIRAGGYITDRFLTGIRPQEYFFHCMAGREGLIDTAVKTSRSGYLQRCLIKGMEGLRVEYDNTVRDSDGSMVQFLYGEDGLDVTKQKHLMEFKFIAENIFSFVEELGMQEEFDRFADDEAMKWNKAAMREVKKTGRIDAMDPVLAHYPPSRHLHSTSETFTGAYKKYINDNPDRLITSKKHGIQGKIKKSYLEACLNMKYLKSIVEPGEAVGIIAGQSIGEPSTQMTLNTFHLAGHSAKNVTLGIPRLREIVMTASDHIATPTMTLIPNPELSDDDRDKFAKAISRLSLAEIIDNVIISEKIDQGVAYTRAKIYSIRLNFYPSKEYRSEYAIEIEDIVRTLESKFVPRLQRTIRAELKKKGDEKTLKTAAKSDALPAIGESIGVVEEARPEGERGDGGSDGDDDDDGDATNAKQRANRAEAVSYAAPDEGEEAIASQARRDASPDVDMEDEGIGGSPRETQSESDDERSDGLAVQSRKLKADQRAERVMSKNSDVKNFRFDDKKGEWCDLQLEYSAETAKLLMLTLVEKALRDAVIQSIPGLGSCTTSRERIRDNGKETEVTVVITEGVNLAAMRDYQDIINPNKILTNDIAAMLRFYGVEACRANIIREMDAVFKSHGIAVDNRHLNLIADMMTRGGGFTPFNRNGLTSNVSPLMKMSFETTVGFLRDAALEGDWDDLNNPSSRIVIGRVGRVGTGAFDVLMPVS